MLLEGLDVLKDGRLHPNALKVQNGFLLVEVLRVSVGWEEGREEEEGVR